MSLGQLVNMKIKSRDLLKKQEMALIKLEQKINQKSTPPVGPIKRRIPVGKMLIKSKPTKAKGLVMRVRNDRVVHSDQEDSDREDSEDEETRRRKKKKITITTKVDPSEVSAAVSHQRSPPPEPPLHPPPPPPHHQPQHHQQQYGGPNYQPPVILPVQYIRDAAPPLRRREPSDDCSICHRHSYAPSEPPRHHHRHHHHHADRYDPVPPVRHASPPPRHASPPARHASPPPRYEERREKYHEPRYEEEDERYSVQQRPYVRRAYQEPEERPLVRERPAADRGTKARPAATGSDTGTVEVYKVMVWNLHPSVSLKDIEELFTAIDRVDHIRMLYPGVAEVTYLNEESAATAIDKYHNRHLDGQPMQLSYTVIARSKVSKTRAGRGEGGRGAAPRERGAARGVEAEQRVSSKRGYRPRREVREPSEASSQHSFTVTM